MIAKFVQHLCYTPGFSDTFAGFYIEWHGLLKVLKQLTRLKSLFFKRSYKTNNSLPVLGLNLSL